jgi:hypothetical protein
VADSNSDTPLTEPAAWKQPASKPSGSGSQPAPQVVRPSPQSAVKQKQAAAKKLLEEERRRRATAKRGENSDSSSSSSAPQVALGNKRYTMFKRVPVAKHGAAGPGHTTGGSSSEAPAPKRNALPVSTAEKLTKFAVGTAAPAGAMRAEPLPTAKPAGVPRSAASPSGDEFAQLGSQLGKIASSALAADNQTTAVISFRLSGAMGLSSDPVPGSVGMKITRIIPEGFADKWNKRTASKESRIEVGDTIIELNGINLSKIPFEEARAIFKGLIFSKLEFSVLISKALSDSATEVAKTKVAALANETIVPAAVNMADSDSETPLSKVAVANESAFVLFRVLFF